MELESNCSVNELELLAVVWAVEFFCFHVSGVQFRVLVDHKALATVVKCQKEKNRVDSLRGSTGYYPLRLKSYGPDRTIRIADDLSRNPTKLNKDSVKARTLWNQIALRSNRHPVRSGSDASECDSLNTTLVRATAQLYK